MKENKINSQMDLKILNNVSLYQAAKFYQNLGLDIVYCVGKACYIEGWNKPETNLKLSDDELQEHFWEGFKNIGIVLRNKLVTVDIDNVEVFKQIFGEIREYMLEEFGECFTDILTVGSKGGENKGKLWFVAPEKIKLEYKKVSFGEETIFELRCGNGCLDVAPPSIHPKTGKPYQWVGGNFFEEMPNSLIDFWVNYEFKYKPIVDKYNDNAEEERFKEWDKQFLKRKIRTYQTNPIVQEYIDTHSLRAEIENLGFVKGKGKRYSLPHKDDNGILLYDDEKRFWSFSVTSPFYGHPANVFDLLIEYKFNGNADEAFNYIAGGDE